MATITRPPFQTNTTPAPARRGLTVVHVLAGAGIVLLLVQLWTFASWLRTGPVQIDRYRNTGDISWSIAIGYQIIAVVLLIVLGGQVVRQCIRERRMTFDAMFCVASACTFWLDPAANYLLPVYSYSAQWINLNDWLGQMPFVRNPDAGRVPEPVLFLFPIYAVGWLLFIRAINLAMRVIQRRWPALSPAKVLLGAVGGALVVDVLFELPMFAFSLWQNQGAPRIGLFANSGKLYPLVELAVAGICFSTLASLRYFRDDRGDTVLERGRSHESPRRRAWTTQLALIGLFNLLWLVMAVLWTGGGLFSGQWKEMKPWVANGVCDAPGIHGTRYGPCPGSPGFRIPLPGSLKGDKPGGNDRYLNGPTQCDGCDVVVANGDQTTDAG